MKLNDQTLGIISRLEITGNSVRITDGRLDRKQYLILNDVLETMGGKWNRKEKSHLFESDPSILIESVLLTGEISTIKSIQKEFGYFPTPSDVVDILIEKSDLKDGILVLEPSAGKGAIAFRLVEEGMQVDCIELLKENFDSLVAEECFNVRHADFLTIDPVRNYDRVIMNPPFAKQQDIDHVLHAFKFLKPEGRLVSVMSAGVLFRENRKTKEFRNFIEEKGGNFTPLDEGAFKESGTMVRTVVVTVNADD